MAVGSEHRVYTRTHVDAKVRVRLESWVMIEGEAGNVSLSGLWFNTDLGLPVGNRVRVSMVLGDGMDAPHIESEGRVARAGDGGVAVEFTRIEPESLELLRDVICHSAEDMGQLDGAFDQPMHAHRLSEV